MSGELEWNVDICREYGLQALNGTCVAHHGDACLVRYVPAAHPAPPATAGEWLADALDRLLLAGEGAATAYERGARGEQVQHEREAGKIKAEILDYAAAIRRAAAGGGA